MEGNTYHMENHQLFHRRGRFTTTALLSMCDTMAERNLASTLVLLDMSVVFDCVVMPIMLAKLKMYRADPVALDWFRTYLEGRTMTTHIGSKDSQPQMSISGVPQGSLLGLVMYTIYTNEVPSLVLMTCAHCNKADWQNRHHLFRKGCDQCSHIINYTDNSSVLFAGNNLVESRERVQRMVASLRASWHLTTLG